MTEDEKTTYFTPRTEGQFRFDELGQRTCLKCGAAICAGCTPEKCGTPCEACLELDADKVDAAVIAGLRARVKELLEALKMVRDADEDCKRDGLPTIPVPARAKIDAAIAKAEGNG